MLVRSQVSSEDLVCVRGEALRSSKVFEVNGRFIALAALESGLLNELGEYQFGLVADGLSVRDGFVARIDAVLKLRKDS